MGLNLQKTVKPEGVGKYIKTVQLREHEAVGMNLKIRREGNIGFEGQDTVKYRGDFFFFDAQGNLVGQELDTEWDCGRTVDGSIPHEQMPVFLMTKIVKSVGTGKYKGKQFNNLRDVQEPLQGLCIEKVVNYYTELEAAAADAPDEL